MRTSSRTVRSGWVALLLLAASVSPFAARRSEAETQGSSQDRAQEIDDINKKIQELQDQVRKLQRANAGVEDLIDDKLRQKKVTAGYKDGFYIQSEDGDYRLKVGGYTQFDGRFFIGDSKDLNSDQFLFRRARLDIQGTVGKFFDFRLLPDFAGSKLVLFDSYLDFKYFPEARWRFGKFKPPVGLERLQSATATLFVERAFPTDLVPNRDLGVQVFSDWLGGAFSYQLGVFNGVPDGGNNDGDIGDDKDFAGRVFVQPFTNTEIAPLKGLGVGFAGSWGQQQGKQSQPDLPTYKSPGQATIFSYVSGDSLANTPIIDGEVLRWTPQGYYYWGPFGMLAEYVESNNRVRKDKVETTLDNNAWQVAGSFVVTGENASYKGVTPARPFDPRKSFADWGAVELAARYSELTIDGDAFLFGFADLRKSVRRAKEVAVGVNWYLNRNIKFVLDYEHTTFIGGASTGDRKTENALLSRVQLVF